MPGGYFDTSMVAVPFSNFATRALVSSSSGSSAARALKPSVRVSVATHSRSARNRLDFMLILLVAVVHLLESAACVGGERGTPRKSRTWSKCEEHTAHTP